MRLTLIEMDMQLCHTVFIATTYNYNFNYAIVE